MECKECGTTIEKEAFVSPRLCWECFGKMLVDAENKEQQKKTSAEEE